jgi:hypothetical protein
LNINNDIFIIPIDIIPAGSPVLMPTVEGILNNSMKVITGYLTDSDYNYNTISDTLYFKCGCLVDFFGRSWRRETPISPYFGLGYLDNYNISIASGGPTLNTYFKYSILTDIDIENFETAIRYQNYPIVTTNLLSTPIKGASSESVIYSELFVGSISSMLIADSAGKLYQIRWSNGPAPNYQPYDTNPIISCDLCENSIISQTIRNLKGVTIITDNNKAYKII